MIKLEKIKNSNTFFLFILFILFILIFTSLLIWLKAPLYPDELAFRISKLRYINDGQKIYDLHGLCNLNTLNLPDIFIPAATILSLVSNILNPFDLRIFTLLTLLILFCSLIQLTKSNINKSAIYFIAFAFVGVAGSGAIIVRPEFITLLLIAICIFGVSLNFNNYIKIKYFMLIIGVIFYSTFSSYIHPQGMLFIPLVIYTIVTILNKIPFEKSISLTLKILSILFIFFLTYQSFKFNRIGCTDSTELSNQFNDMVFQWGDIKDFNFIKDKLILYSSSFLYKSEYLTNYLPGVIDENNSYKLKIFNVILNIILISIVILNFIYLLLILKKFILSDPTEKFIKIIKIYGLFLCLTIPSIFLIFYDKNQYFYRSIFINILLCSSLVIFNSNSKNIKNKYLDISLKTLGPVILFFSILINYKLFYNMLPNWNAIYSVSVNNKLIDRSIQIDSLLNQCNVNIKHSKFIVDEYTYEYFKYTQNPQIIYYVSHQATVTNKTITEVMRLLNVDSVVASCSAMKRSRVGWPTNFTEDQICCFNLHESN